MPPSRQPEGAPPPVYGSGSCLFSIEINHGGYFLGTGCNRSYVSGGVIWIDDIDIVSFSSGVLDDIIEEIGYETCGRIQYHYCIPFLTIARNGLRQLQDADDFKMLITFVEIGNHFVSLYLNHDDSIRSTQRDDVLDFPVATLPAVISPAKATANTEEQVHIPLQVVFAEQGDNAGARTRQAKRGRSHTIEYDETDALNDKEDESDEDLDFDPKEIVDSDYDLSVDDDDLFEDNIDDTDDDTDGDTSVTAEMKSSRAKSVKGKEKAEPEPVKGKEKAEPESVKGKEKVCKKEVNSEEEDLWGPASDDDTVPMRFKAFREVDLVDPQFHVGQTFETVQLLRRAIQAYSCKHRKDIKLPVNDLKRLNGRCIKDCSWYLWASYSSITKCFMIKKYIGEHTCGTNFKVHNFTSNFLAEKYLESFRADQDMNMKNFKRIVQKEWCMTPGRCKMQRARRLAMAVIYGDEEAQYKLLWDFGNEIRRSNPGSSFFVSLDENSKFKRAYKCLEASKKGFLEGCRPVIFLDGCFIMTRYIGQLLAAVGMDPNNCIYPIVVAVVEVEDTANWTWFLETLKSDLGIDNTTPWTIMSDKQKGLINAVKDVFPNSEHRFCVRHMWQNFQQLFRGDVLKNQLWRIARSSIVTRYEAHMEAMKVLHPDAWAWLSQLDPKTWVRAFQSDLPKCDILLNNNCEVFNKYILEARELPVLSMFERIKSQMMSRNYNKQKEEETWPCLICPKIKKIVLKHAELSNNSYADGAGDGVFQVYDMVSSTPVDYIVDLKTQTCTCNRWQKTGIPCPHVVSVARKAEIDPLSLVENCYSIAMHKRAYGNVIYPCKDRSEWEQMGGPVILPPLYKKQVGRPTKNRRKAPGEVDCRGGGKRMSRHGVIMHCSHCGEPSHNRNGCYWFKNGLPPPDRAQAASNPPLATSAQIPQPDPGSGSTSTYQNTVVDSMTQERPFVRNMEPTPTPPSAFISAAQAMVNQGQATSSTLRQGELAQKLLALQHDKNKAMEDRKMAILEAKYQAELRKAELAANKRLEVEKKKAEQAQARAAELAAKREKRKYDAAINRLTKIETRRIIAEVKKSCAEEKKLQAAEKKKLAAEEKKLQAAEKKKKLAVQENTRRYRSHAEDDNVVIPQRAKKVSMFDELRAPPRK